MNGKVKSSSLFCQVSYMWPTPQPYQMPLTHSWPCPAMSPERAFVNCWRVRSHAAAQGLSQLIFSIFNQHQQTRLCAALVLNSGSVCPLLPHLIQTHSSPFSAPLQTQELTFTVTWMGSLVHWACWCPVGSGQWK